MRGVGRFLSKSVADSGFIDYQSFSYVDLTFLTNNTHL